MLARDGRGTDAGKHLVAYVVPADAGGDVVEEVREHLRAVLPHYMLPSAVVVLEQLPLTVNGKLDRAALPEPHLTAGAQYRAPSTAREEILCNLFAEVLGIDRAGMDDDFFDLGGHSLLATRLTSRIRAVLDAEVPVRAVFETPTPAGLIRHLDAQAPSRSHLTTRQRPHPLPLSFAQRRLWFLHHLEGPSPTYNIPLVLRLTGDLDPEALATALNDVASRHETLRTVFPDIDGIPHQHTLDHAHVELTTVQAAPNEVNGLVDDAVRHAFDLAVDLPIRAWLFTVTSGASSSSAHRTAQAAQSGDCPTVPAEHVLVVVVHHIAGDGWSLRPLASDLATAYAARRQGRTPAWEPLPVQYA
ncbi:condensation domain-containing protein, partial [Microbispora sp. NPDC049633]|uniref:condensation domain-containing protein n=1 Tax=Microbispora sp. NPDC049633 TaxID=3154355 RepID=UPI003423CECA